MNKQIEKWCELLESGNFEQGKGKLIGESDIEMNLSNRLLPPDWWCCLGVLAYNVCDVPFEDMMDAGTLDVIGCMPAWMSLEEQNFFTYLNDGSLNVALNVLDTLDLSSDKKEKIIPILIQKYKFKSLNFKEIAEIIRIIYS